jgi:ABC-type sugar transport system substrate-binding protein
MTIMPETIGLFLRSTDNDYQQRLKELGLREAKKYGIDLLIESAQNDPVRQVEQIRAAVKNAATTHLVGIMVATVRDEGLPEVVREAVEAGIDFGLLNEGSFIDEIHAQYPNRAIFAVTSDQTEIGRIHGRQVRALIGEKGNVLTVTGPMATVMAQRRLAGLKEVLGSDFTIVELNADWTSERARMEVMRWADGLAANGDLPSFFVGHNDEMALGIRQALRDASSKKDLALAVTNITGCDGSQTFGQRLVKEGRLKATVIMPPSSGAAVECIAKARNRGERPPVRVMQPVTSFPALSNLKQ